MVTERFRSHHDAEQGLAALLGRPTGRGLAAMRRLLTMKSWAAVEARLREPPPSGGSRGVYIHVPYCDKLCSFCNLNRKERKGAGLSAYVDFVVGEIKAYGAYPYIRERPFDAVYFGGGTPTILSLDQAARILDALHEHIPLAADCEITMESTLHNLGAEKAAALEDKGVTRFSIGIQTFQDRGRKLLGRTHSGEKALEELRSLRATFTGTLGIDIIYSYPDQSCEEIIRDAEICISSGIDSVSFYSLMIHQGSALAQSIAQGKIQFVRDIESDKERHNLFYKRLTESGFTLLELSKLARPGKDAYRYIHIQYENEDLLPLGSGAGGRLAGFQIYSMAPGRRFVSAGNPDYDTYYLLLGELQFGLYDPARLARFLGPTVETAIADKIQELCGRGFLVPSFQNSSQNSAWHLSPDGIFWGNNIAVEVLAAAIAAKKGERMNG